MIEPNALIQVKEGVLFQELNGEAVLLNLQNGIYFGLNPTGVRVWQLIADGQRMSIIAETIQSEYDVSEAECLSDLAELLENLRGKGLIRIS